ncbi:MAG: DUF6056 family protein [Lachnospiraceae bacterium]|nr:DUF6056 family protein [Lachnospiraceae bacterium]
MEQKNKITKIHIITAAALLILLLLEFILHVRTPFMKDDLWYATNLVTGEKIAGLKDIIQSQIWHYFNWGGRIVNHGLLQAVLSSGETGADILNILATLILGFAICSLSERKNPVFYLISEALIISFNASIHFSMCWESGSVNYLYSTSWILAYVFVIFRELKEDPSAANKRTYMHFLIIPLSFIAGMSTENMGPTCFVATIFTIVYLFVKKRKVPFYLYTGAFFTLLGSALMILAPGNFVRNAFIDDTSLKDMLSSRFDNLITSTGSFLFVAFLTAFVLTAVYILVFKLKPDASQMGLLLFAITAQAAMFLSPAYPQRASFGIMCVLIAYIVSILKKISDKDSKVLSYIYIFCASVYIHALIVVCTDLVFPPVLLSEL